MRAILLLGATMVAGCATVTGGSRDPNVTVTSSPEGAAVLVDGDLCGVTPAIIQLSRKTEHKVQVTAAGCEPANIIIQRNLNPWVFGNIIVGGLLGVVVDVCTDATYKLSPNEVHVNLKPLAQIPEPSK